MSDTRKDLEKQAKNLGIDADVYASVADLQDAVDLKSGAKRSYLFSGENTISVVAADRDEADKKYAERLKELNPTEGSSNA